MALTRKQEKFKEEYLICFNATEAYHRVYAPKTREVAASNGYRLLRNAEIAEAVKQRLAESAMSADEVLMRLAEQARGDLGEFLSERDGAVAVDLLAMRQAKKTHLIKKITQTKRRRSFRDVIEEETTTSLELYDAQSAQVHIGRHHKLFTDRSEVTVDDTLDDAARTAKIIALLNTAGERRDGSAAESRFDDLETAAGATD